jgi:hypothetical protein
MANIALQEAETSPCVSADLGLDLLQIVPKAGSEIVQADNLLTVHEQRLQ